MKSIEIIRQRVQKIPRGKPFTAVIFRDVASNANVRQALSRLVKTGELTRAAHGIFVRPKEIPYLGKVLPEANEIAKIIARNSGETIAVHGAEAARLLQLSTQVPLKTIFYTTGNSRRIKIGNLEIIFKHISPRKLIKPGTTVGLVISALWYLGKNNVNENVIKKIKKQLSTKQFFELFKYTQQMPAWMAGVFYNYRKKYFPGL